MHGSSTSVITVPAFDAARTLQAIEKRACEHSLAEFIRRAWHIVEPGEPYLHNWHIDLICAHLEAITFEEEVDGRPYNRLLINVPPGMMKSLILNVFWPSWEWGPCKMPHQRYLCAAHAQHLAIRDSTKMRRLVESDWYQQHWGDIVKLTSDQNAKVKFENTATGFREAIAAGSITGARGTRVIIDDPHSVEGANSDAQREATIEWFTEAVQTRLNNPKKSAIVVIMQRLHEEDVSGVILERKGLSGTYDHICLPMRYETWRNGIETKLGYSDPRTEEGELLFEERFPKDVVDDLEAAFGPYATAGQHQQTPTPRGGGVIKEAWWQLWSEKSYPALEYVMASLDTAYTEKTENDFSAMTVWGVWSQESQEWGQDHAMAADEATRTMDRYGRPLERKISAPKDVRVPKVIMTYAWQERLELHDLVLKVAKTCKVLKVDRLLIENKASGHSVAQELRRLFGHEQFAVQMYDPKSEDKLARLYSVQALFSQGLIYAPDKEWAETVIRQVSTFPRGKHDDLVDTVSSSLRHLRDTGMLAMVSERVADKEEAMRYTSRNVRPLYGA